MGRRYPEIIALQNFVDKCSIISKRLSNSIHVDLIPVSFQIADQSILIHIQDEYNDLDCKNPLLDIVLCLRELELISDSNNFENWCQQQGLKGNKEVEDYFNHIVKKLPIVKDYFLNGTLNSFISDMDFQLNSGAAQELRR